MAQLEQYFRDQLAAGYTYEQLVEQLRSQNYSDVAIERAYANYQQEEYTSQLRIFVDEQIANGAKPELLQEQLVAQGYDSTLVSKLLYPHHAVKHHHIISFLILLILAVGITLVVFSFFTTDIPTSPTSPVFEQTKSPDQVISSPLIRNSGMTQVVRAPESDEKLLYKAQLAGIKETDCVAMTDELIKNMCWKAYSLQEEVPARCTEISSLELQDDCYFAHLDKGAPLDCTNFNLDKNVYICRQI